MSLPMQGVSEKSPVLNPIGVYRHPQTKAQIGCIDPIQADYAVGQGFQLVKECQTIEEVVQADRAKAAPVAAPVQPAQEAK